MCSVNGRFQSKNANTVDDAKCFLGLKNALSCPSVQGLDIFRARFVANVLLRRMPVKGDANDAVVFLR